MNNFDPERVGDLVPNSMKFLPQVLFCSCCCCLGSGRLVNRKNALHAFLATSLSLPCTLKSIINVLNARSTFFKRKLGLLLAVDGDDENLAIAVSVVVAAADATNESLRCTSRERLV